MLVHKPVTTSLDIAWLWWFTNL